MGSSNKAKLANEYLRLARRYEWIANVHLAKAAQYRAFADMGNLSEVSDSLHNISRCRENSTVRLRLAHGEPKQRIIELLLEDNNRPQTMSEIRSKVNLAKPTLYHSIACCQREGWLEYAENNRLLRLSGQEYQYQLQRKEHGSTSRA
jgi:hypothetical protein